MGERTVTINSISKTYSVTGWRVGWAIAHKDVSKRIRKVHDFLTVGAPTPLQHAGAFALTLPDSYYVGLREHYQAARVFLYEVLCQAGFQPSLPKGAYYILADCGALMRRLAVENDLAFSHKLIEVTGVATVPGSSFFFDKTKGITQVRFAFCRRWETVHAVKAAFQSVK